MSFSNDYENKETEVVFPIKSPMDSSEEVSMSEWSSLEAPVIITNPKRIQYEKSLYSPGSGELCAKYIRMSDSSVLEHVYYNYPCIQDPGIEDALLLPEPQKYYPDDGQYLYLDTCKEMNMCPVRMFYKSLPERCINLRYYCINPNEVNAMCTALRYNRTVEVLDLTDNFLNDDACYHLGDVLKKNTTLKVLNLSGCRIGPIGAKKLLNGLQDNVSLHVINLNRNQVEDEGVEFLAETLKQGTGVGEISLGNNNLGYRAIVALSMAFETSYCSEVTHLDLSWNKMNEPAAMVTLLTHLSEIKCLEWLDLSWNSLYGTKIGTGIKLLLNSKLKYLNLSNNQLTDVAVSSFLMSLKKAKSLKTLDLSYNPMTADGALDLICKLKLKSVKIQNLLLDNVTVNEYFIYELNHIKTIPGKENLIVTHGFIKHIEKPPGKDPRETVMKRIDYLSKKHKKRQTKGDFAITVLKLERNKIEFIKPADLATILHSEGVSLDHDLLNEVGNVFPGRSEGKEKAKTIDVSQLVDFIHRFWPDRELIPTPPSETERIPSVSVVKLHKKSKKDVKKNKKA